MATKFYLENRPNKQGEYPIRVGISMNRKRFLTSVGYSISNDRWDDKTKRAKRGNNAKGISHTTINKRLNDIEGLFMDMENKLASGDIQDIDIKATYKKHFGKDDPVDELPKTFFDFYDEFTAEMGKENGWTLAVHEKFNALANHLKKFKPDLSFDDLDKDGLNDLVDYFHKVTVAGRLYKDGRDTRVFGMKNTTIKKEISFLKWFLRWATTKGYNKETAFQAFKPKLKETTKNQIVFLTWDELMQVYNFQVPDAKKYLDRVRDVFCFQCFSSLRYSDVANLTRSNVFDNYINVVTIKTGDALTIDLNDYSKAILDKYRNETFPHNRALPVISNQRMNEYLKELCEMAGIDAPVTITYYKGNERYDEVYPKYALVGTHTGRRTFISNAIMMGIAPQIVMKWTGHSDYKAMKPYIDIADQARRDAMKMFNRK